MAKKYIVKNCPAYSDYCEEIKSYECQDCTDCLIKQVIEKCKNNLDYHNDKEFVSGRTNMAGNILALFEIEEVNNDR